MPLALSYADRRAFCDTYTYGHHYCNSDGNSHSHSNTDTDTDTDTYTKAFPHTAPSTYPSPAPVIVALIETFRARNSRVPRLCQLKRLDSALPALSRG